MLDTRNEAPVTRGETRVTGNQFLVPRYWLLVVVVLTLLFPAFVFAQSVTLVPCAEQPLTCTFDDLLIIPVLIFNYALRVAALVLLAIVVFSGSRMTWFYLAESPASELENAKYTLTRGLVGFAIVAGAILIVNILLGILGLASGGSDIADRLRDFGIGR